MSGYRFVLELPDGDAADPAIFNTAIPTWREGDEFLAGSELQPFRILSIHTGPRPSRLGARPRGLGRRAGLVAREAIFAHRARRSIRVTKCHLVRV
jgi:hypothetical protein